MLFTSENGQENLREQETNMDQSFEGLDESRTLEILKRLNRIVLILKVCQIILKIIIIITILLLVLLLFIMKVRGQV